HSERRRESAAVEESPSSQRVIPSEGAKRRSRGIAVVPARHSERRRESAAVEESPSSQRVIPSEGAKRRSRGIAVVPARHSERRREAPQSRNRRRPSVSFRAKARSAAVEESPSSRPPTLPGRSRFPDSLRSLGTPT